MQSKTRASTFFGVKPLWQGLKWGITCTGITLSFPPLPFPPIPFLPSQLTKNKRWYDLKPTKEVPVYHTGAYCLTSSPGKDQSITLCVAGDGTFLLVVNIYISQTWLCGGRADCYLLNALNRRVKSEQLKTLWMSGLQDSTLSHHLWSNYDLWQCIFITSLWLCCGSTCLQLVVCKSSRLPQKLTALYLVVIRSGYRATINCECIVCEWV